jgi:hypothetical protein
VRIAHLCLLDDGQLPLDSVSVEFAVAGIRRGSGVSAGDCLACVTSGSESLPGDEHRRFGLWVAAAPPGEAAGAEVMPLEGACSPTALSMSVGAGGFSIGVIPLEAYPG